MLADAEVNARGLKTAFQELSALAASARDRSLLRKLERKAPTLKTDTVLKEVVRFRQGGKPLDAHVTVHKVNLQRGVCSIDLRGKDGPVANELQGILEEVTLPSDPRWDKIWDQRRRDDRLIAEALATVGLRARSIYWLVNDKVRYGPEVVTPLLGVLPRIKDKVVREGIFRALRMPQWTPEARTRIVAALLPLLTGARDKDSRWELGMVLTGITPPSIRPLVKKTMNGARLSADEQAAFEALARPKRSTPTLGTAKLPPLKGAAEASVNLDLGELRGVLARVSKLVKSGFGSAEIKTVVTMAKAMEVEEERALDFKIRHGDKPGTLRVSVFLDDVDSPDLYLHSDVRALIKALDGTLAAT